MKKLEPGELHAAQNCNERCQQAYAGKQRDCNEWVTIELLR
jgi:hypothetical protein